MVGLQFTPCIKHKYDLSLGLIVWQLGHCKKTQLKHTLLEVVQIAELHQVVAVVIVCDIDLGVFSQGILHPGSLVAPITVLLLWLLNGC